MEETVVEDVVACLENARLPPDDVDEARRDWLAAHERAQARERARADQEARKRAEASAAWRATYPSTCRSELSLHVCHTSPESADEKTCLVECAPVIARAVDALLTSAELTCVHGYVAAEGKGTFACSVDLQLTADARGAPGWSARVEACSADCVRVGPVALTQAREAERAQKEANEHVLAFKRCMVDADSSPTAIKYAAYDADLYDDLMTKAEATCRTANKCDLLEAHTDAVCAYAWHGGS
jgi:hypothetical protein